jgi:hypothetical protein
MLKEFALHYKQKTGKEFDVAKRHIRYTNTIHINFSFDLHLIINYLRCLAHILNLATQLLISTKSKAKYYSVHDDNVPDADTADPEQPNHDEVGLVHAICVKVWCPFFIISDLNHFFKARSSSQRKELFKKIQIGKGVSSPVQLLLDMKVCWGSTYVMLNQADNNCDVRIIILKNTL